MTATSHALVGVAIAAYFSNPWIAIPVAATSHVVFDMMPHWDVGTHYKKKGRYRVIYEASIDVLAGFILSYLLIAFVFPKTNLLYATMIILVSQGLDWVTAPSYMLKWMFPPFSWFHDFSEATNTKMDKPWGIVTQVVAVVGCILLAKLF